MSLLQYDIVCLQQTVAAYVNRCHTYGGSGVQFGDYESIELSSNNAAYTLCWAVRMC